MLSVLFRPECYQRLSFDKHRLKALLDTHAPNLAKQITTDMIDIKARDGTVIGYRIELRTLKTAESLFEKCGPSFLDEGIETTHYGHIFEKQNSSDSAI